jgi:NAD+ synthase
MDLCLYAYVNGVPAAEAGPAVGLSAEEVERVWRDIEGKRKATAYLHAGPLLVDPVPLAGV